MPVNENKAGGVIPRISIAVLVGGASSRMGEDKAMKLLGGKPLVSYVLDAMQPLSDDVFLVGKDAGGYRYAGLPVHGDRYGSRSSLIGIYTALEAAREQYCLVAPCDMPFIAPGLARLMAALPDGFDAVVPEGPAGREPLFSLYSKSCLVPMANSIRRGRMKLGELLDEMRVRWVRRGEVEAVCDPARTFFNVNSPSDLILAQSMLDRGPEIPAADNRKSETGPAPLVCFVGHKNSGKTSFIESLTALLTTRGLRVACIKHDTHGFSIDREGTDTWRFSQAGAARVIISAPGRAAMLERVDGERGLDELRRLAGNDVDIVFAEGFKRSAADKIEVHGDDDPEDLICPRDELLAVITDRAIPDARLRSFGHGDIEAVACLIEDRYGMTSDSKRKERQ
jgi:molybdopterin-guanine dinucleotide biosynthesis protein MobB